MSLCCDNEFINLGPTTSYTCQYKNCISSHNNLYRCNKCEYYYPLCNHCFKQIKIDYKQSLFTQLHNLIDTVDNNELIVKINKVLCEIEKID